MIEIEEVRHAISVAREYANEGRFDACQAVVVRLLEMFPKNYRFGRHVALALGAPEWGVDWAGFEQEILSGINAQIIDEMRRRDRITSANRRKAQKPRKSRYESEQKIAADVVAARPNTSANQLAALILDRIQTESESADNLPSEKTVRNWIEKLRST